MMGLQRVIKAGLDYKLRGQGLLINAGADDVKNCLMANAVKPTESLLEFIAHDRVKPKLMLSGSAIRDGAKRPH